MLDTMLTVIGWAAVAFMLLVTLLLLFNKKTGLSLIQHVPELLPQAMLVRYAGMSLLALVAAWLNAPGVLLGMLLSFSVIGFGDALVYRRAGRPHWMHLVIGAATGIGALIAIVKLM